MTSLTNEKPADTQLGKKLGPSTLPVDAGAVSMFLMGLQIAFSTSDMSFAAGSLFHLLLSSTTLAIGFQTCSEAARDVASAA